MKSGRLYGLSLILALSLLFTACAPSVNPTPVPSLPENRPNQLVVVAGSEIKALETAGIFTDFAAKTGIAVNLSYKGSVDIKNALTRLEKDNPKSVDIYWPASSIWLPGSSSPEPQSVMKTYVVLAVKPTKVQELGWDTHKGITILDVLSAIKAGKLHLAMTSASQSNSGATFYLAALTGLSGGNVLTSANLADSGIKDNIKTILGAVTLPAESTGFLKDTFVADYLANGSKADAIVLYESLTIEANKDLVAASAMPLTVFYVGGATAVADSPIRFVDNGDPKKLDQYNQLVTYLRTPEVQVRIQALGWRTNLIGMALENADQTVFNPNWGIDTLTDFPVMTLPKAKVVDAALSQYQTTLKKPAFTVYCLDLSGSMTGNGGDAQLRNAMDLLLDQTRATEVSLQANEADHTVVYGFNRDIFELGSPVTGNNPDDLKALSKRIQESISQSNTNMFGCVETAIDYIKANYQPDSFNYSVIVLTDGASNAGPSPDQFREYYLQSGLSIPVYAITFGDADTNQLTSLTQTTGGNICDGRSDMAGCFRKAKGNN